MHFLSVHCSGDSFIIFSGGMPHPNEQKQTSASVPLSKPSSYFLTILRGQSTNVLHMDNPIVDFHVISSSPHIAGLHRTSCQTRDRSFRFFNRYPGSISGGCSIRK